MSGDVGGNVGGDVGGRSIVGAGGDAGGHAIASSGGNTGGHAIASSSGRAHAGLRLAPLAIVLVAAIFRMWRLGDIPPGFQFDEAHNAIDAARFIDGIRPLFLPDNGGREVLLTWLHAPVLAAIGRDHPAFALRLVNSMIGTLTVALVGVVTGRLFGDRRLGWLAAAFLALMYWHLHFSRYAIRAILAPLWATGAIGASWLATERARDRSPDGSGLRDHGNGPPVDSSGPRAHGSGPPLDGRNPSQDGSAHDKRRLPAWLKWSTVTGICLAAAVYSHPSGRLLPFILLAHAAFRLLTTRWQVFDRDRDVELRDDDRIETAIELGRESATRYLPVGPSFTDVALTQLRALTVAGGIALLLFVPLGTYFLRHPELFTGHASDVSLASVAARDHDGSIVRALLDNAWAIAGMFAAAGDPSTFHNLPDLPVYDPLTALLALFGAGVLFGGLTGGRGDVVREGRVGGLQSGISADRSALVVLWLLVGIVPTLLSDRPPNYSRAIAATPVIALLPALGLRWLMPWLSIRWRSLRSAAGPRSSASAQNPGRFAAIGWVGASDRRSVFVGRATIATALGVAGAWTAWHHFVAFPRIEQVYYSYDVEKLDALDALEALAPLESTRVVSTSASVFLHPLWARHATIDYLNRFVEPGMSGELDARSAGTAAVDSSAEVANGLADAVDSSTQVATGMADAIDGSADEALIRMLDPRDTLVNPARGGDVIIAVPSGHDERERILDSAASLIVSDRDSGVPAQDRDGADAEPGSDVEASISGQAQASTGVISDALGAPLLSTLTLPAALWGDFEPPTDAPLEPATWTTVRFGGAVDLVGYTIGNARAGEELPITVVWRSLEPIEHNLTVFVHLVGPSGESWGQDDREPGHASFRTSDWRSGDVIVDRHRPELAVDASGKVGFCIGWYDHMTGERLRVGDGQDAFCPRPIQVELPVTISTSHPSG